MFLMQGSARLVDLFDKTLDAARYVLYVLVADLDALRIVNIDDRRVSDLCFMLSLS